MTFRSDFYATVAPEVSAARVAEHHRQRPPPRARPHLPGAGDWDPEEGQVPVRDAPADRGAGPEGRRCRRFTLFPPPLGAFITLTTHHQEIDNACAPRGQRQAVCSGRLDMQLLASNKWVQAKRSATAKRQARGPEVSSEPRYPVPDGPGGGRKANGRPGDQLQDGSEAGPEVHGPQAVGGAGPRTHEHVHHRPLGRRRVSPFRSDTGFKTRRKYANKVSTKRKTPRVKRSRPFGQGIPWARSRDAAACEVRSAHHEELLSSTPSSVPRD